MRVRRGLDLYCCEGGASKGFTRAGYVMYGIDLFPKFKKRYPYAFAAMDALAALTLLIAGGKIAFTHKDGTVEWLGLEDFDFIHTSPPCQGYTIATTGNPLARAKHQRLIAATRELLIQTGLPWIIENVEQALDQMNDPVLLCGRMFDLHAQDEDGEHLVLDRHRLFETNFPIEAPEHEPHGNEQVAGVYGGSRRAKRKPGETLAEVAPRDRYAAKHERKGGYVPRSRRVQEDLLGIDWMTMKGMQESLPPVYTEWVGRNLIGRR